MPRRLALTFALLSLAMLSLARPIRAQDNDTALSEAEIEQIRNVAYYPNDRVLLFIKILDTRTKSIQDLYAHPRKPGREQDTHDLMEQFTFILNELEDNLDDYSTRHNDIRKALPKLLDATERWSSALKSPPDDEAYNVSRKLSLEAIRDLHEDATQLIDDQKNWFFAHPPPKEDKNAPIQMPR
jgi:hypothetical protein